MEYLSYLELIVFFYVEELKDIFEPIIIEKFLKTTKLFLPRNKKLKLRL
jgi:hypothetical protein